MAAGLGFKTFNTGDVLSAADTNGYLMQGIWVFANATARDAAVTSPQEGNACYLKDTDVIQVYTGSAWAAQSGGSAGLTLIGTTTFSSSSAVNINNVFSATYDNYRVVATFSAAPSADLLFRYRVSGSDNTTSNYALQGQDVSGTSTNSFRITADDKGRFGVGAGDETGFAVDMFSPFLSRKKRAQSTSNRGAVATPEIAFFWNTFNATTSFTGLTIYPASGTVTGEISVYGYAK